MKELSPQRELFAQAIASGDNQSDAYRRAYKVGVNTKPSSINCNAAKLMSDTKVRQRVAELKKQLADKELWTREDSIRAMIEVIKEPENQGSKISAVKVINDMQGFNAATKTQVSGTVTHEVALDQLR